MRRSRENSSPSLLCVAAVWLAGCGVEATGTLLGCPAGSVARNGRCELVADGGVGPVLPLVVAPLALDFPPTRVGSRTERSFEVFNPNPGPAEVFIARLDSPAFVTASVGDVEVPGGGSTTVTVTFTPVSGGEFLARVRLETCGGGCPVEVTLQGEAVDDVAGVLCEPLDFGDVALGQCSSRVLPCTNVGNRALTVGLVLVTPSRAGFFAEAPPGAQVGPGETLPIEVSFCPTQPGFAQAEVQIRFQGEPFQGSGFVSGFAGREMGCQLDYLELIDFGPVPVGRIERRSFEFFNIGRDVCRLTFTGWQANSAPQFRVDDPLQTLQILSGQSRSVPVFFDGAREGDYQGSFSFRIDGERGLRYIQTLAQVVGPSPPLSVTSRSAGPLPEFVNSQPITWIGNGDDGYAELLVDFPFTLFGRTVRRIYVSTNGFIGFSASGADSLGNSALPDRLDPNHLIAWWWDDLNPEAAGPNAVRYAQGPVGPTGQRALQIRFEDIPHFTGGNGPRVSADITLFEGDNRVEVHYGERSIPMGQDPFDASAGWEAPAGLDGADILNCSPNCNMAHWPRHTIYTYRDGP